MKTRTIKQFMIAVVALIGLLPIRSVAASATLSIEDFTIKQGETKEMLIDVNNANMQVTMVEFYMQLPSGLSVATENGELAVDIAGRTTWKKHSLEASFTDGTIHFFLYSGNNAVLTGTSGAVISVKLTTSSSFIGGNIVFERQLITAPDETECKPDNYIYKVETAVDVEEEIITFADDNVKAICVANWDTNGDGELSKSEAAAVTDLGTVFRDNTKISTFEELHYFVGLTSIGDYAFYNCSGLTSINLPSSVTNIGNYAFFFCRSVTSINIPSKVTTIGDNAFTDCNSLICINIPSSVTNIGNCPFSGCRNLEKITVDANNTVYDSRDNSNAIIKTSTNELIKGCVNTIIPGSVTTIGNSAFYNCSGLTSITIPKSVTAIGSGAFHSCGSLISVNIPNSVTSIGDYAFDFCSSLTSINIPSSITSIGDNTFGGCRRLTSITIPNSVTCIGNNAFNGCGSLTSINIPNSMTSIGAWAFYDCNNLTSVKAEMSIPFTITQDVFSNRAKATLYVMQGCKAAYEGADYWKEFKEIVEINNDDESLENEETDISTIDNVIYLDKTDFRTGEQATFSLKMKNAVEIRGFQFDLYLPEGVTVVKSSKGKIQGFLSEGRLPDEDEHTLTFSEQPDGAIRFLCSSQYDETFTGNDGEIATLRVNIAEDMADGDYPLLLKNIKLTETDISKYYETPLVKCKLTIKTYMLGDINADGVVDVSDYTGVANHIHGNTPEGFVVKAADVDGSGTIDVSDYTGIANIIHTGSIYGNSGNGASSRQLCPKRANTDLSGYDNVIYISPFVASAGTQIELSVKMKNTAAIRGFQFDLYLPGGMKVVKSSKGRIQGALSSNRLPDEDEHDLTFSEQPDGAVRFLCSSQYDETFTGSDGEIATLKVDIVGDMANGNYPILLKNMKLTETDITKFYTAEQIETTVSIGEVETGIETTHNEKCTMPKEFVYDLQGRKVMKKEHLPKGMYVINGRKVVK